MEKKNIHEGHRKRLRDQVAKSGLDGMPEYQVLEYMLSFVVPQKDTNVLAHNLINRFGDLPRVLESSTASLTEVDGIGEVVAHFLANFRRMYEYYQREKGKSITTIGTPREAKNYMACFLRYKLIEELYLVGVDGKNKVVFSQKISSGTSNKNNVSIRMITDLVMQYKVDAILVAHNHPDGEAVPSMDDDRFTRALFCTMGINGIKLLDHLIITNDSYYSYFSDNVLENYKNEFYGIMDQKALARNEVNYEVRE